MGGCRLLVPGPGASPWSKRFRHDDADVFQRADPNAKRRALMPYFLIPLVASLVLGTRFILMQDPSRGLKVAVGVAVALSLVIWWKYPALEVLTTLVQAGVSIFVLVYQKVNEHAV